MFRVTFLYTPKYSPVSGKEIVVTAHNLKAAREKAKEFLGNNEADLVLQNAQEVQSE